MRRLMLSLFSLTALLAPQTAFAGQPAVGVVTNFGPNLATVCPMPEGIAVDPTGNLYASSFAFKPVANICEKEPRIVTHTVTGFEYRKSARVFSSDFSEFRG